MRNTLGNGGKIEKNKAVTHPEAFISRLYGPSFLRTSLFLTPVARHIFLDQIFQRGTTKIKERKGEKREERNW